MGTEIIKNGYKIKISRNRTHITAYQDMILQTTQPIKADKQKRIKPSIPSDYADHNYYNRMKSRRNVIKEICYNNFALPYVVMITLTFDQSKTESASYTDLKTAHYEFKKFIQRINNHYDNFKYIVTFNRQSNGNWHYHLICNFQSSISNESIKALWGKGITYITYIKSQADYKSCIKYLIDNMNESAAELKGKRGYLASKSVERDIVYNSWSEKDANEFAEAFDKIQNTSRKILYETKNHLGIKGTTINEETGEFAEYHLEGRELNPTLEQAGYESWDTIYTHLTSSADFSDYFSLLEPAVLKVKKWKHKHTQP